MTSAWATLPSLIDKLLIEGVPPVLPATDLDPDPDPDLDPDPEPYYARNENTSIPLPPTLWPFNDGEILVCFDVECHCFNQTFAQHRAGINSRERRVCEVGVSILDSKDVVKRAPGDRCQNWWKYIHTYSFVIKENAHFKKGAHSRWCKVGGAEDFLFGKAKWVSKANFKRELLKVIMPFIGSDDKDGHLPAGPVNRALRPNKSFVKDSVQQPHHRPIVFMSFALHNDLMWLRGLDTNLRTEFPSAKFIDIQKNEVSQDLAELLEKQTISAADLFDCLGLQTKHTHNGGNDSAFELQAFLAPFAMSSDQWADMWDLRGLTMLPASWSQVKGSK